MAKKALVLGGETGLLGQALVVAMAGRKWQVACLGRESATSEGALRQTIESFAPDLIFNTIAFTQCELAEEQVEEAYRINQEFPERIGRLAMDYGLGLVHYSTDFVFAGQGSTPLKTDDPAGPVSIYGASKLAGEEALLALDIPGLCIIRTAWLFGHGRRNFVSAILNKAKETGQLRVVNDQTGSPTYTKDLAEYSLALIASGGQGLFHVVNGGQATWYELARAALECAGLPCDLQPISTSDYAHKCNRPAYSVLDTSTFTDLTGIKPRPWAVALKEYLATSRGEF